jgi:prepilin-type N-terminal cleavage/methylation domain-containing protein
MINWPSESPRESGFSLLELSIVLIVFALLAGSLLTPLRAQQEIADEKRARQQLDLTLETLYGFAITQGRLPCPAAPTLSSTSSTAGEEDCSQQHGVIPWRSLGLSETDPWGQRLTYFAGTDFTRQLPADARAAFTLQSTSNANVRPAASSGNKHADKLPAIIVSHGRNGLGGYRTNGQRTPSTNTDEAENADADLIFVNRLPDDSFDDLLTWINPAILNTRLMAAGRLP